jgi:Zn finger protein HypA/HybF involved in hydrogenase expression
MKYLRLSSIVQELLAQKITHASVQLAVGELILDEALLQKEWRELTKPTPLSNTKLNIRIVPTSQQCMWCFLIYHPKQGETTCPQCHSVGAKILSGEEFYLDSI